MPNPASKNIPESCAWFFYSCMEVGKSLLMVAFPWCIYLPPCPSTHSVSLLSCSCTEKNTMSVIHKDHRGPCYACEVTRTQEKAIYTLVLFCLICAVLVAPLLMYIMQPLHDNLPKSALRDKRSCAGLQAGLGLERTRKCKVEGKHWNGKTAESERLF